MKMNKNIEMIINFFEIIRGVFFTFHTRPASSVLINKKYEGKEKDKENSTAIVIQGPILRDRDFTFETIATYKKIFPHAHIILSTWKDEAVKDFQALDIEIILSEKPKNPGISNINYQITSTINGIYAAKKLKVTYVLKTRTDQRIYSEKAISYYQSLVTAFSLNNAGGPKGRIVATDMNTFKYRPYSISDMTLFGYLEDMLNYWDLEGDDRVSMGCDPGSVLEWSKLRACEVFLSSKYLEKMGAKLTWTLSDSWRKYTEYFCIADRSVIDLYWFKYGKNQEYRRRNYDGNFMNEEFDFAEWLNLYSSGNFDGAPEHLIYRRIQDTV